jgi:transcriptional regulator with XRE-family HTH domain
MTLGEKVKELRARSGLTQKDLADKVAVTAQAVSRWEQDIVEPDIGTLKKLSEIFAISLDILLSNKPIPNKEPNTPPIIIQQVNPVPVIDQRRTIGVCETCNRPILEGENIHRHGYRTGKTLNTRISCDSCETIRINSLRTDKINQTKKNRFWGLIVSTLLSSLFLYGGLNALLEGNWDSLRGSLIISYAVFAFVFTMMAKNTFLNNFFFEITSWGFITLPGVIFSFDIDGLLFLITAKIILFFVGIGVALAFGGFALVLSFALSLFVFPFSLLLSFTSPQSTHID